MTEKQSTIRQCKIELARRSFWHFLKVIDPKFFKESRPHLKEFANTLQSYIQGDLKSPSGDVATILVINMPPRVGKSYTLTNFCAWLLGFVARLALLLFSSSSFSWRMAGHNYSLPSRIFTIAFRHFLHTGFLSRFSIACSAFTK